MRGHRVGRELSEAKVSECVCVRVCVCVGGWVSDAHAHAHARAHPLSLARARASLCANPPYTNAYVSCVKLS